jgi:hypothetical protein
LAAGAFLAAAFLAGAEVLVLAVFLVAAAFLAGAFFATAFLAGFFLAAIRLTSRQIWTPDSTGSAARIRSSLAKESCQHNGGVLVGDAVDHEMLGARRRSHHDPHVACTDTEGAREESTRLGVGSAVDGRCRDGETGVVAEPTGERGASSPGLHADGETGHDSARDRGDGDRRLTGRR